MTLGILGLGRIGKRFAHIGRNSFARVIACDPYIIDGDFPAYVQRVSREELFEQADAISLHVPLSDDNRCMVDASLLSRMRAGSVPCAVVGRVSRPRWAGAMVTVRASPFQSSSG